ncbi:MAG: hypothetical protein ABI394_05380 [Mycobacterium sp.]
MSNIFGIDTSQLTVVSSDPTAGLTAAQLAALPTDGTVYSVTNLGSGIENVHEAIPGTGGAAMTITDALVTPHGDTDLSSLFSMFDAIANFDAGDAVPGVTDSASGAAAFSGDLSDILSGMGLQDVDARCLVAR